MEAPAPGGLACSPVTGSRTRCGSARRRCWARRGRRGVRRGGGLLARHAGPATADRSSTHDPRAGAPPRCPTGVRGAAAGSRTDRRRRQSRPVAHRRAADRSGDRGGAPRQIGLPRPRAAAARPVPTGLPHLLPQHRPARVDRGRTAPRRPRRTAQDSAAERLLVRLLRDAGIGGWVLGHPFGPWRIDLAFPQQKVAVEVDSWAWHVDAERFRTDRRKQNALVRRAGTRCASPGTTSTGGQGGLDEIRETLAQDRPALLTIGRHLPA